VGRCEETHGHSERSSWFAQRSSYAVDGARIPILSATHIEITNVILSEVAGSHREAAAQSKDPCSFYGSVGNQKGILL